MIHDDIQGRTVPDPFALWLWDHLPGYVHVCFAVLLGFWGQWYTDKSWLNLASIKFSAYWCRLATRFFFTSIDFDLDHPGFPVPYYMLYMFENPQKLPCVNWICDGQPHHLRKAMENTVYFYLCVEQFVLIEVYI